jgi:hypothetical protein
VYSLKIETLESNMKERIAKTLTVGSRLCWDHNAKDGGTVIEVGYNACKVKWDDPRNGEISLLYFTEMANIGFLPRNEQHAPGDITNLGRGEVGI